MKKPSRADVLLSVQRALLGEVSPNLRGVSLQLDEDQVTLSFYVDGHVDDDDRDSLGAVGSEVAADVFPAIHVRERVERVDSPAPLPLDDLWAYRRKEAEAVQPNEPRR